MNIRELRKAYNLSQAALAEKLGVTAKTISRLENGQMMISDQIADRIWDQGSVSPVSSGNTAIISIMVPSASRERTSSPT